MNQVQEKRNVITKNCKICLKSIFFRKNGKYTMVDLCSSCQNYNNKDVNSNNKHQSCYRKPKFDIDDSSFTWGERFQQGQLRKYSNGSEDDYYSSCKVSSTTFIPERPNLGRRFEADRFSPIKIRFQIESRQSQDTKLKKHNPIVFDGETHSNKKFKLVNNRKEESEEVQNEDLDDSFSSKEEGNLVIDHDFEEEAESKDVKVEEPTVSRDPRLNRKSSGVDILKENILLPVNLKTEKVDTNYYTVPSLNLNPFMLEIFVEGIRFMAELDTSNIDMQISMDVAEVIEKEVMKSPTGINRRDGWSNIYPGKVVPVSLDINNFLQVVAGTLRSDISYKVVLGREALVTFGYNFSVCGLPVKQRITT